MHVSASKIYIIQERTRYKSGAYITPSFPHARANSEATFNAALPSCLQITQNAL